MSNTEDEGGSKSLIPQPLEFDLSKCALLINETCGTCKHLHRMPHPAYGEVCSQKGIMEVSKPCKRYSPDTRQLNFKDDEDNLAFAKLMAKASAKQLKLWATVCNREARTRKAGFSFGEIAYMRIYPADYISNYRMVRVQMAEKKMSRKEADLLTVEGDGFTATVYRDSILNALQWRKKKKELKAAKRVMDPAYKSYQAPTEAELLKKKMMDDLVPVVTKKEIKNLGVVLAREDVPTSGKAKGKGPANRRVLFDKNSRDIHTVGVDQLITRTRG